MRQFVSLLILIFYLNNPCNSFTVSILWIALLTVSYSTIRMSFATPYSVKTGLKLMIMCVNTLILLYITLIAVIG